MREGDVIKAVILAGGFGTRLSEETMFRPKPMVEIGDKPVLWHIMNIYAAHGVTEFVIALGYKGEMIKDYFLNFCTSNSDISIDLASGRTTIHDNNRPPWTVHLVDTGLHTQTGGRLKRLRKWLENDATFCFTYGDGVADIDIRALLRFHESHGKLATVTTVRSPARFGRIHYEGDRVTEFFEKPEEGEGWINGGFFVLNPGRSTASTATTPSGSATRSSAWRDPGSSWATATTGSGRAWTRSRRRTTSRALWQSGKAPWKVEP